MIWVFAGHTGFIVGYVMHWFNYHIMNTFRNTIYGLSNTISPPVIINAFTQIRDYKMLNSAEHEICPANKSQIIYNW